MPQAKRRAKLQARETHSSTSSRHGAPSPTGDRARRGRRAAGGGARGPESKDLRETWWKIGDQGCHGLVRRLGDRRRACCAGTWSRPAGWQEHRAAVAALPSGWPPRRPTSSSAQPDHLHRGRRHEPEGRARRRAQVRRRPGHGAAVRVRRLYAGERGTFYAIAAQLKIARTSTCASHDGSVAWRTLARDAAGRSSPGSTSTRRGTTRPRRRATSTPTSRTPRAAGTPSRWSATPPTASSSATAGAPAGETRASPTRPSRTRRRVHGGLRHLRVIALVSGG